MSLSAFVLKVPQNYTSGWKWILFVTFSTASVARVWRIILPLPQWLAR